MSDIDVGQLSEAINDKADRDLNNTTWTPMKNDLSNSTKPYLKTTYVSGTSGYRIWTDGYCEQWGHNSSGTTTISFLKTFKDTNYTILLQPEYGSDNVTWTEVTGSGGRNLQTSRTTSSQTVGTRIGFWLAKGYLATGQY